MTPQRFEEFAELIGASVPTGTPGHVDLILKLDLAATLPQITDFPTTA